MSSNYNIHYERYKEYAICKYCDTKISTKGSQTSGLKRHFVAKHEGTVLKRQRSEDSTSNEIEVLNKKPKLVQRSISANVVTKKVTLHELIAKMAQNSRNIEQEFAIFEKSYQKSENLKKLEKLY